MTEVKPKIRIKSKISIVGHPDHDEIVCFHGDQIQIPIERIIAAHMLAASMGGATVRVVTEYHGEYDDIQVDVIDIVSESQLRRVN